MVNSCMYRVQWLTCAVSNPSNYNIYGPIYEGGGGQSTSGPIYEKGGGGGGTVHFRSDIQKVGGGGGGGHVFVNNKRLQF